MRLHLPGRAVAEPTDATLPVTEAARRPDGGLAATSGPGLLPRPALTVAPFVAIPVIGELVAIWSADGILVRDLVVSTCLLAAALLLVATRAVRESALGPSCILVCYVASVATLELAVGGTAAGTGALLVVPLVASALFFGTAEIVVAAAAVATASVWTAVVHDLPPEVAARRVILLIAISILIAVPIHALRAHLRAAVRETRRLLNQSRTLEAAARELTTLGSEEEIVAATVRLAALVASPTGTERPRAWYERAGGTDRAAPAVEQPEADRSIVVVRVQGRPGGADHGALLVELDAGTVGRECEEGLAALAQIMELALSNLFAHRRLEAEAMNEERRRIARELHDGLAHELAFIAARARTASEHPDELDADELQRCADRALDEARRAITVLSATEQQRLGDGIAQTAEDLGARYGIPIELRLDDDVDVDAARAEHLLRIVREAISNAARHGHPSHLVIHLWHDDAYHLVVEDDGVGFELDRAPRGFGLTSMRERAEAVGGELSLRSAQNGGTRVEVHIP